MKNRVILFLLAISMLSGATRASGVIDVPSSLGEPTRTLLVSVPEPRATVLLYIGGDGRLRLTEDGRTSHGHTFVRSLHLWSAHHINAVLVDTPFDLGNAMRGHKRGTQEHLSRVAEVISHYSKNSSTPVWIFGHSMGTSTVAAFLSSEKPEISRLRGYIVAGTHKGETIPTSTKIPVMAIHHKKEACEATPIEASEAIVNTRSSDTPKALVLLDGGLNEGHRCQARAYHGFYGIENELINTAASFVLKH